MLSQNSALFKEERHQAACSEFHPCRDSVNCWFNLVHCFSLNSLSSPPVLEVQAVGTAAGGCYNLSRKKEKGPFLFTLFLQKRNKTSGFGQVIFLAPLAPPVRSVAFMGQGDRFYNMLSLCSSPEEAAGAEKWSC